MADWTIVALLVPVIALPVIYLVVRARHGAPPPHEADAARHAEIPHEEDPVPRRPDGTPFPGVGDPAQR